MQIAMQDFAARLAEVSNVVLIYPLAAFRDLDEHPVTIHGKWVWPHHAMAELVG